MRSRYIRALTPLIALLALAVGASSAQAIIPETSQITTPAGTTFPLYNYSAAGPEITVAGTTTGSITEVDIRCYYGAGAASYKTFASNALVTAGTFSTTFPRSKFTEVHGSCRLRAVPTSDGALALPPGEKEEFEGPMINPGIFDFSASGYSNTSTSLGGLFFIQQAEGCGLESTLLGSSTLEESEYLFFCNGGLTDGTPTGAGAVTATIDGSVAYGPRTAEEINAANPGLPKLSIASSSYDESNGDMTITELDPFVRCAPEANANPGPGTCSSFVSTGVTLERTWMTSSSDHVATMRDVWRSTDGNAHEVKIRYYNEFQSETGFGVFEFPGTAAFAPTTTGETVALPGGPGTILYKYDSTTPEAGNGVEPQGAIVYDRPSGPLIVKAASASSEVPIYEAPYTFAVPAGGTSVLRMAFIQGFGLPEVEADAATARAAFTPPTISIAAPANGASIETESPTVAVSGSAADSGALASVSVNGSAATLSPTGAWSATAALKPGANTITATATDDAGLTASATVTVNYKIPPGKASLAGAITTNKGNVSFTLKCAGAAGAVCTVKDSLTTIERRKKAKILGLLAKINKKTVTVASGTQTIAAGKEMKITLTLNNAGKALLKRFKKLPGALRVTVATAAKPTTAIAENITVTAPKPKKKKKHKH